MTLRRYREAAGLTQMELANLTGMDMAEISRLELGKRDPRLSTIVRVATALGLTTAELVHDVGPAG